MLQCTPRPAPTLNLLEVSTRAIRGPYTMEAGLDG
jgi:hypothetical protein